MWQDSMSHDIKCSECNVYVHGISKDCYLMTHANLFRILFTAGNMSLLPPLDIPPKHDRCDSLEDSKLTQVE